MYSVVLLLVVGVSFSAAYPGGAGDPACSNGLVPNHGGRAQTSPSPYSIIAPFEYSSGGSIKSE